MRCVEFINIHNVKIDRIPLQNQTLNLANKLNNGKLSINDLPPIHTELKNGCHYIKDGRHRYSAIRLIDGNKIKCKFYK